MILWTVNSGRSMQQLIAMISEQADKSEEIMDFLMMQNIMKESVTMQ